MAKNAFLHVAVLAISLVTCLSAFTPSRAQTAPPDSASRIAGSLQPFLDRHVLAGAVTLVASKDKVLSLEAVGYADLAAKKPMQTDCLFRISSRF